MLFGHEAAKKIDVGNSTPAAICNYAFFEIQEQKIESGF